MIHATRDIGYLFPDSDSTTCCGQSAKALLDRGEFIGTANNLNENVPMCPTCKYFLDNEVKNETTSW